MMTRLKPNAFSLIEISVVLVIIGLLVGGILAGQNLVRGSAVRSLGTQMHKYVSAVQSFQDEFRSFPGDMKNATIFWGTQHAVAATCQITASSTPTTCNGDGDRVIGISYNAAMSAQVYERYRAWQHLANAGLIEGNFNGVSWNRTTDAPGGASTSYSTPGTNTPVTKVSGTSVEFNYSAPVAANGALFIGEYYNFLTLGVRAGSPPANTQLYTDPALTPQEAWNMDTKIDDGYPSAGGLMSSRTQWASAAAGNCYDASTPANYNLSNTGQACTLLMIIGP